MDITYHIQEWYLKFCSSIRRDITASPSRAPEFTAIFYCQQNRYIMERTNYRYIDQLIINLKQS
jgi:hypothetical protein